MNGADATQLVNRLVAAYPTVTIGKETRAIFADQLIRWELPAATAAVQQLIENVRFFPAVLDLREAYTNHGGDLYAHLRPKPVPPPPDTRTPEEKARDGERVHEFLANWRKEFRARHQLDESKDGA